MLFLQYSDPLSAKTYEVETASIAVDFTEGQDVYEGIAAGIEGKEIGTLGEQGCLDALHTCHNHTCVAMGLT